MSKSSGNILVKINERLCVDIFQNSIKNGLNINRRIMSKRDKIDNQLLVSNKFLKFLIRRIAKCDN